MEVIVLDFSLGQRPFMDLFHNNGVSWVPIDSVLNSFCNGSTERAIPAIAKMAWLSEKKFKCGSVVLRILAEMFFVPLWCLQG